MPAIQWSAAGERFFSDGLDRAVLYPPTGPGVPWNGFVNLTENVSGGDIQSYYFDGNKFLDVISGEDYQATLEALYYPREFEACQGVIPLLPGVYATGQQRVPFGLSYRVKLGNDTQGLNRGYEIHLVYNATVSPNEKARKTVAQVASPGNFQWTIDCAPPGSVGYKPTAHFVINSLEIDPDKLAILERLLYGGNEDTAFIDGGEANQVLLDTVDGGTPESRYAGDYGPDMDGGEPSSLGDRIEGGRPSMFTSDILEGGSPSTPGEPRVTGGSPSTTEGISGGSPLLSSSDVLYGGVPLVGIDDGVSYDGGTASVVLPPVLDGGTPERSSFDEIDGGYADGTSEDIIDGGINPWMGIDVLPSLPSQAELLAFLT